MVVTCFSGRVAQTTWDAARGSGEDVKMLMKVMRRRRFVMMLRMKWVTCRVMMMVAQSIWYTARDSGEGRAVYLLSHQYKKF